MRKLLLAGGLFGLFLAWNMPNHYPPWTAFHGELAAALAACLLFAGVAWPQQLGRVAAYTAGTAQGMLVRLALPAAAWVWLVAAMAPEEVWLRKAPCAGGQIPGREGAAIRAACWREAACA